MAVEVVMPRMGLTMEEGTVVHWHKQQGEPVVKGELLLEIETDKVTAEVEANADGVLGEILVGEGITVPIGTPIAYIIAPGEALPKDGPPAPASALAQPASPNFTSGSRKGENLPEARTRLRVSPAARRAARELGMDLRSIQGRGPRERILETDVRRAWDQVQRAGEKRLTPVAARMVTDLGIDLSQVEGSGPRGMIRKSDLPSTAPIPKLTGEYLEVSGIRRVMAKRMADSFSTAPHFYLIAEADASALATLREELLPKVEARAGVRLTYTDLLAFFLAKALAEQPLINAAWVDGHIRMNQAVNLGIAVDSERGLVVPVIHAAEKLPLGDLARARAGLTEKAHSGKLSLDDLANGTFTLSNLGTFRVDMFNAILNPPQAAILAVGRIHEKVLPHEGQPLIRPVIGLSLTCDHRVLDGATGARFLSRIVELIEEPHSLFL